MSRQVVSRQQVPLQQAQRQVTLERAAQEEREARRLVLVVPEVRRPEPGELGELGERQPARARRQEFPVRARQR